MPFVDFHARFYANSGDTTVIDRVNGGASAAAVTYGSDSDGEYLRTTVQTETTFTPSIDIDTAGITFAVLFKPRVKTSGYFMVGAGRPYPGGDAIEVKCINATDLSIGGIVGGVFTGYSLGNIAVGSLVGFVAKWGNNSAPLKIWLKGATHTGNNPDQSVAITTGAASFNALSSVFHATQSGNADCDVYVAAVWDEQLSDAECRTLVESLYSSIRTGTLGGGNLPPLFNGPAITVPTLVRGVAMSAINTAPLFSDPEAQALTFSAGGSWPPGITVSSAGVISGTPTTAGTYTNLVVTASDGAGTVNSNTFTITVNPPQGVLTLGPWKNGVGSLLPNLTGLTAFVENVATGAIVVTLTGQTTNGSAMSTLTDPLILSGTEYRVTMTDGVNEGMQRVTAA